MLDLNETQQLQPSMLLRSETATLRYGATLEFCVIFDLKRTGSDHVKHFSQTVYVASSMVSWYSTQFKN